MIDRLFTQLRAALRGARTTIGWIARGWRFWLATALLGALLVGVMALREPRLHISEGRLTIRPRIMLEGYLLTAAQLGESYAIRLRSEERVERVAGKLGLDPTPLLQSRITSRHEPGIGIVHLQARHPEPDRAEDLVHALLTDFRRELETENLTRPEADRLIIEQSAATFARPAYPSGWRTAMQGALAGTALGMLWVVARGWLTRGRVQAPLDAEQLTGAPTLAAIPGTAGK